MTDLSPALREAVEVMAAGIDEMLTTPGAVPEGSVADICATAALHALIEAGWTVQRASAPSPSTDIQCTTETEKTCTQPWHMDDGVPYCTTCGLYRNLIHQQETARARRK
ncbi:MAG: hypothetical protein P4L90_25885 [Rhodopila sp.]|nr:hypothetical protein [Rhodopila sp.]